MFKGLLKVIICFVLITCILVTMSLLQIRLYREVTFNDLKGVHEESSDGRVLI